MHGSANVHVQADCTEDDLGGCLMWKMICALGGAHSLLPRIGVADYMGVKAKEMEFFKDDHS